jgi:hypothetical protein
VFPILLVYEIPCKFLSHPSNETTPNPGLWGDAEDSRNGMDGMGSPIETPAGDSADAVIAHIDTVQKQTQRWMNIIFCWCGFLQELLAMLRPNLKDLSRPLTTAQELMAIEIVTAYHNISRTLPYFCFARLYNAQIQCLAYVFFQYLGPCINDIVLLALYNLSLDSGHVDYAAGGASGGGQFSEAGGDGGGGGGGAAKKTADKSGTYYQTGKGAAVGAGFAASSNTRSTVLNACMDILARCILKFLLCDTIPNFQFRIRNSRTLTYTQFLKLNLRQ